VKLSLLLCEGVKKKFNIQFFSLREEQSKDMVSRKIFTSLDTVYEIVKKLGDGFFEAVGCREWIPKIYQILDKNK
jgi:hypothetical protein